MLSLLLGIFTFVELNCENLFDTQHDSLKQDQEYLADGVRHWNRHRYWDKVNHMAKEIISCGDQSEGWRLPDFVALCEVENDSVMRDLTERSLLRNGGYRYVMTNSPDERGIDVALLYSTYSFHLIHSHSIRIDPMKGMRPTRDILYVMGTLVSGDTIHLMVVHAPSRFNGEKKTRPHRLLVAEKIIAAVDTIRSLSPQASIIIMGDFNDETDNHALRRLENKNLYDVSQGARGSNGAKGTYKYKSHWQSIDHIFVNEEMRKRLLSCVVHDPPFLLEDDRKYGGVKPRRNYNGYRYNNGYSDHLPLVARFRKEE